MEGTFDEPGFVVPSLTGTEFARAAALTSIHPQCRMRRNRRRQLVDDGEKGWQIGDRSTTDETRSTTIEYDPDTVYEPSVYSNYLTTRLYCTQRDRT
ncbi:hypothetical protein [Streptomyces sp. CA-179760]|uniref:hypothetical protein n=1 Tax=Streptomyces sp. CA-179760 TaxID=3240054 RepID=UPI003D8EEC8B